MSLRSAEMSLRGVPFSTLPIWRGVSWCHSAALALAVFAFFAPFAQFALLHDLPWLLRRHAIEHDLVQAGPVIPGIGGTHEDLRVFELVDQALHLATAVACLPGQQADRGVAVRAVMARVVRHREQHGLLRV